MEITLVSEEDLKRLAEEQGPRSAAATVLRNLTKKRAKDRQVFAWQLGQYYFVGPTPHGEMEARIRDFVEDDRSPTLNHVAGWSKLVDRQSHPTSRIALKAA